MEKQTITYHGYTFEIVDRVPYGYAVWNINDMGNGYLPLCRLAQYQPFPGGRNIEVETLKAIKCEGAKTILEAIGWGPETPEEMERYIEKHEQEGTHTMEVKRMKKALPLMRQIWWS